MAKIVKILCAIVFSVSFAFGANASSVFANFDKNYVSASKTAKKELHSELKKIYSATSNKDKKTKISVLKRLTYSSEVLGYSNYSVYKSELEKLGAKADYKPSITDAKKTLSKADLEFLNSGKITPNSTKIDKSKPLILQSISNDENSVRVKFNRNLDHSEYKNFVINKDKVYRYVLDFNAKNSSHTTRLTGSFVDEVRTSQYNDKIARVVLNHNQKFNPKIEIFGNELIIAKAGAKIAMPAQTSTKATQVNSAKSEASATNKIYKSTKGKLIVIDPGHGGKDSGAIGNGLKEKTIVLATSKKLGALLQKRGYKVLYTRSNDVFINLKSRTAFANKKNADMFISVHANAAPNAKQAPNFSGVETFFLSPAKSERSKNVAAFENQGDMEDMNAFSQETFLNFLNREKIIASNKLAIDIQSYMLNSVQKSYKSKDGGVREGPFWVLVGATMPAVLVEMGYISHPSEGKNLGTSAYQDRIAQGIANGVDAYFQKNK
ncbi:N-acetylmuramoyl-L-alanine amidase [Campylobacter sp. JMF_02 ED1]|uniref:N-acetylmuramoyl-L-alanine amidase n=1 Tax=unclassified Campylobacter TaxID=2593542 RepID=UPI0022E9A19C|nr:MULTISPECIES: N-acetylmuramoyl-L-alanine amidase [unclassified Campylobacter]MDA3050231.1 N-acetylmuramoyl-L-alanine amidase [Campylobacter sp. JMF_15 NE4]MDA3051662.1 N-acetylmuramoyl-L-alanine amidase [Campylobacter sp. JMF_02 ED1]